MNFFKKKQIENPVSEFHSEVLEKAFQKPKSANDLVEEIHETFFTEVDRLLAEAKILKSTETTKGILVEKAKRLKALGFTSTTETIEGNDEAVRLQTIEYENEEKLALVRAIEYFSNTYPQYKFITEESIQFICNKYGLVYSGVGNYIGVVPDENLEHIEKFEIKENDCAYFRVESYGGIPRHRLIDYQHYLAAKSDSSCWSVYISYTKASLVIAAPISNFNMKNKEVVNHQIVDVVKDPVVFQPVYFQERKYYLIVTAWGKEASDELVVNEKMN